MNIRGKKIKNEFDLLCAMHDDIDGALKVRLARIYEKDGMGGVISELRNLGHEGQIKEDEQETISLIGERTTLSKILPDTVRRARRKHQATEITKRLFGMGREREGD
jgi:hypothetical protein